MKWNYTFMGKPNRCNIAFLQETGGMEPFKTPPKVTL